MRCYVWQEYLNSKPYEQVSDVSGYVNVCFPSSSGICHVGGCLLRLTFGRKSSDWITNSPNVVTK